MPRTRRQWTSQKSGSFHIISRAVKDIWLNDKEKEYFLELFPMPTAEWSAYANAWARYQPSFRNSYRPLPAGIIRIINEKVIYGLSVLREFLWKKAKHN